MTQLFNWIAGLFSNHSRLETYIINRNPTSIADIEFWTREYEKSKGAIQ